MNIQGQPAVIMRLFTVSNIKGLLRFNVVSVGEESYEGSQSVLGETIKMSENSSLNKETINR